MRSPAHWRVGFAVSTAMAAAALAGAAALAVSMSAFTSPLVAQGVLVQLGLTEASARTFLFDELKTNGSTSRRSPISVTGHRAFYKLPPAARGPAATALFAWARGYVNSPAFRSTYAQFRKDANPVDERPVASVAEEQAARMADLKANLEMGRKIAESLPPADRDKMLAKMKEFEKQMTASIAQMGPGIEAEQAERIAGNKASDAAFNSRFPADLNVLVARRLRAFLEETADADFSAPIIRLTGGPDGMEFISPAHQQKTAIWQMAVLAGPDATRAARAAAEAWLKEVAP